MVLIGPVNALANDTAPGIPSCDLPVRSDADRGAAVCVGPRSHLTLEVPDQGAHVTFARAGDLMGRPVNLLRPVRSSEREARSIAGLGMAAMPSRMPVSAYSLTSSFGLREHPLLGVMRAHSGIDLAAPLGSPIFATSDGTVSTADWRGGYGLLVSLDHGGGVQTRYGHMSRLNVVAGEKVRKGDVIGYIGSTGLSTGPHLHYEIRLNGRAINPAPYLKPH